MEPDIIGDLGVITAEKTVVEELVEICKQQNIPIILDCVQQLGRTGSYWGDYVDHIFSSVSLLVITTGKSASNGQPLAFTLLPQVIADAAYPLTQLTTNQMNCSLLRTVVVAEILKNPKLQDWINKKSLVIEKIASSHNISLGENGLRGKYLNRGIYIGDNEKVKLVQLALFIEDGILVGAFPKTIRYQPMLLELTETNQLVADIICRRINKVLAGDIA